MSDEQPRRIGQVLLATGLSVESAGAVKAARRVAESFRVPLHAVYAIETVSAYAEQAVLGLVEAHDRQAREEFQKFASTHGLVGADLHVRRGSPVGEVLAGVHELGADSGSSNREAIGLSA